ncbi:hypothetical protein CL638_00855 [bacterium]|nr:hypothetical protein [bacterium]
MMEHHAVLRKVADIHSFEPSDNPEGVSRFVDRISQFGIADARALIAAANRTPTGTDVVQEIIVITGFITVEAQQALLKIIEEPPNTTRFLFVVPNSLQLLPTLLSRFAVASTDSEQVGLCSIDSFQSFKEASVGDRIAQIEVMSKNKDNDWQNNIKCGLIEHLNTSTGTYSKLQLESLQYVASTLLTRGASNKMLLEELALTL